MAHNSLSFIDRIWAQRDNFWSHWIMIVYLTQIVVPLNHKNGSYRGGLITVGLTRINNTRRYQNVMGAIKHN